MLTKDLLDRYFIGWDTWMKPNNQSPSYPPFNVIKHSDTEYSIEMAVAGFSKEYLTIELCGDHLLIKGHSPVEAAPTAYLYRGLSSRSFTREFKLSDTIVIKSASLVDGILIINLESETPEELKPKVIEID